MVQFKLGLRPSVWRLGRHKFGRLEAVLRRVTANSVGSEVANDFAPWKSLIKKVDTFLRYRSMFVCPMVF